MRNGSRFAYDNAGWRLRPVARLAGSATVPKLLALLSLYLSHDFFAEWVIFIFPDLKQLCRTSLHAVAAAIALVRIENEEPVAGTILETIRCLHFVSFLVFGLGSGFPRAWYLSLAQHCIC